jgi:hypothetical protein
MVLLVSEVLLGGLLIVTLGCPLPLPDVDGTRCCLKSEAMVTDGSETIPIEDVGDGQTPTGIPHAELG